MRQRSDFSHTGQWEVVTENKDGHRETQVFDGVFVCAGTFTHPVTPLSAFPGINMLPLCIPAKRTDFNISLILSRFFFFSASGMDTLPGKTWHSWEYKDPQVFQGKRVVVIGFGNSGGDIAVEISRVAESVSTIRGLINTPSCTLFVFQTLFKTNHKQKVFV